MPRPPFSIPASLPSLLFSILALTTFLLTLQLPQRARAQSVEPRQVDSIRSIHEFRGSDFHVPVKATLVFTDTFFNAGFIVGPGPGVLMIDDVIVDGHLVIRNGAINYGPILVNGQLTTQGVWQDASEAHLACDPIRDICVDSWINGHVTNRGLWNSDGLANMCYGITNEGQWRNNATIEVQGTLNNSGWVTNTGQISVNHTLWNRGVFANPGLLENRGTIFNWGILTGQIENDGVIFAKGIVSATVEGDGSVVLLDRHVYIPFMRVATLAQPGK